MDVVIHDSSGEESTVIIHFAKVIIRSNVSMFSITFYDLKRTPVDFRTLLQSFSVITYDFNLEIKRDINNIEEFPGSLLTSQVQQITQEKNTTEVEIFAKLCLC